MIPETATANVEELRAITARAQSEESQRQAVAERLARAAASGCYSIDLPRPLSTRANCEWLNRLGHSTRWRDKSVGRALHVSWMPPEMAAAREADAAEAAAIERRPEDAQAALGGQS